MLTTESWICPYCRTKFDYVVLNATIVAIDTALRQHRLWCKQASPEQRRAWMEAPVGIPGSVKYTLFAENHTPYAL